MQARRTILICKQNKIWNVRKYLLTTYQMQDSVDFLQVNNILNKPQQKLLKEWASRNQEQSVTLRKWQVRSGLGFCHMTQDQLWLLRLPLVQSGVIHAHNYTHMHTYTTWSLYWCTFTWQSRYSTSRIFGSHLQESCFLSFLATKHNLCVSYNTFKMPNYKHPIRCQKDTFCLYLVSQLSCCSQWHLF
jgi:hypothetical protein